MFVARVSEVKSPCMCQEYQRLNHHVCGKSIRGQITMYVARVSEVKSPCLWQGYQRSNNVVYGKRSPCLWQVYQRSNHNVYGKGIRGQITMSVARVSRSNHYVYDKSTRGQITMSMARVSEVKSPSLWQEYQRSNHNVYGNGIGDRSHHGCGKGIINQSQAYSC